MKQAFRELDLEFIIEQKIIELYGDPDDGLKLKKGFVVELRRRMTRPQTYISHADMLKKYGLR